MPYDEGKPDFGQCKQAIERELRAMDHSCVTRCFGYFIVRSECKLVLELMQRSLRDVISVFLFIVSKS